MMAVVIVKVHDDNIQSDVDKEEREDTVAGAGNKLALT